MIKDNHIHSTMKTNTEIYGAFPDIPRQKGKPIDWKKMKRDAKWRKTVSDANKKLAEGIMVFQPELSLCPICAEKKFNFFIEVYSCKYSQCESCGHIFMQPQFDVSAVKKLYSGDGGSVQEFTYLDDELFSKRVEQVALPKIEYCNGVIGKERGLWVDVGCGTGELLTAAKKTGWTAKGFEADAVEVDFARRRGVDVVQEYVTAGNANELKCAKVVSLLSVLEHVNNPLLLLKTISGSLSSGAYVVFEVPRHPSLSSFVNMAFPQLPYRHICPPAHLHIFTEKSIDIMLRKAGLAAKSMWEFGQDALDFVLTAANNAGLKEDDFIQRMIGLANDLQKTVDEKSLSDVIFMIAVKR